MRANLKPSTSSRTSVRTLIVACLPTVALGVIANSPALASAFNPPANPGLTTDDNAATSTNAATPHAPNTNSSAGTNSDVPITVSGMRG